MKKRRILSLILSFILVFLLFSWQIPSVFAANLSSSITISDLQALKNLSGGMISGNTTITFSSNAVLDADYYAFETIKNPSGFSVRIEGNNSLIKNLCTTNGFIETAGAGSNFAGLGLYNCTIASNQNFSDNGVGLLCGNFVSGTVTGCFATGSIYLQNSTNSNVGGLIGKCGGTVTQSYSMCDIYTDASNVGGLIGNCTDTASISYCYSTGSIENGSKNYIGGLVGLSDAEEEASSNITNSYTNVLIKNAYVDTVKAIGFIRNLSNSVFYDVQVSIQRQYTNDSCGIYADQFGSHFTDTSKWTASTLNYVGLYPQLVYFSNNSNVNFRYISAISAAEVNVYVYGDTVGKEYVALSSADSYARAVITTDSSITWHISGGIDEYLFNPAEYYDAQKGGRTVGLSGNTYDHDNGYYLFVNEGDVNFTAESHGFERTITVHVTNTNPYFSSTPFIINTQNDFEGVRVYCNAFDKTYTLNSDIALSNFKPISGFKGTFNGNDHTVTGLTLVPQDDNFKTDAGFFSSIRGAATISGLHIAGAVISASSEYENSGILVGNVDTTEAVVIDSILANGTIVATEYVGGIVGKAVNNANLTVSQCNTMGSFSSKKVGGIISSGKAAVENCYSTAVLIGTNTVGGIFADAYSGSTVNTCLFTGMFQTPATGCTRNGIANSLATKTYSYYDTQSTAVSGGVTTEALIAALPLGFSSDVWVSNGIYPELKCFSTKADIIQRASMLSAVCLIYKYAGSSDADSEYFDSAKIDYSSTGYATYSITYDDSALTGKYSATSSGTVHTYRPLQGGEAIAKMTLSPTANTYNDVRSIRFNVKSATIYYKFNSAGTGYSDYISKCVTGMAKFSYNVSENKVINYSVGLENRTTAFDEKYKKVVISPVKNTIDFDLILPKALDYSYTAKNSEDQNTVLNNHIVVPTDGKIYLDINIASNTLPWGNYDYKSN